MRMLFSAVEKIKYLLEDNPVDICDRWVSTHVVADNVNRFISNRNVRVVSILFILVTLQAILDCAHASFDCFDVNRDEWMMVRTACKDLLGAGDFDRYRELYDEDDDKNCQTEWSELLKKFDPNNEDVRSSDFEGQANLRDDFKNNSKVLSIQKREVVSGERQNTRTLDLCDPILSMPFGKLNGAKANLLGWLFGRLSPCTWA